MAPGILGIAGGGGGGADDIGGGGGGAGGTTSLVGISGGGGAAALGALAVGLWILDGLLSPVSLLLMGRGGPIVPKSILANSLAPPPAPLPPWSEVSESSLEPETTDQSSSSEGLRRRPPEVCGGEETEADGPWDWDWLKRWNGFVSATDCVGAGCLVVDVVDCICLKKGFLDSVSADVGARGAEAGGLDTGGSVGVASSGACT